MTYTEKALQLRPVMEQAAQSLDDNTALTAVELFPKWNELVDAGKTVEKGFRFQHNGTLWRTEQPSYTFNVLHVPGSVGMESLFSEVNETNAGTRDDPIPYNRNMEIFEGKYYIQNEVVYLCTRNSGQPLYNDLRALVGIYVEVVV